MDQSHIVEGTPEVDLPVVEGLEEVAGARVARAPVEETLRTALGQQIVAESWDPLVGADPIVISTPKDGEGDFLEFGAGKAREPFDEVGGIVRRLSWHTVSPTTRVPFQEAHPRKTQ